MSVFQTFDKDDLLVKTFTNENGLPQNSPNSIIQTKDGYIWIATFGGLARFDGVRFTTYLTGDFPSLTNNRLLALAEDKHGTIWIGSEDGDLMSFREGEFKLVIQNSGTDQPRSIHTLFADKNDTLWIGTSREILAYNNNTGETQSFSAAEVLNDPTVKPETFAAYSFASDNNGTLWIGSSLGLIEHKNGAFRPLKTDVLSGGVARLFFLPDHPSAGLFISQGIELINLVDGVPRKLELSPSPRRFPEPGTISDNDMFIARDDLYRVSNGGIERFPLPQIVVESIPLRSAGSTLFDREGNIWVGTQTGLIRVRKKGLNIFTPIVDNVKHATSSIIETADRTVWVSSRSHILKFDPTNRAKVALLEVAGHQIISLARDANDDLWVGTQKQVLKYQDGNFVPVVIPELAEAYDFRLYFDRDRTLWIGTKGGGIFRSKDGKTERFTKNEGLIDNEISRIVEDSKGNVWIGTRRGLSRFDEGAFTNFSSDDGLTNIYVRDIYEDADGGIWVGTYGGGLFFYRSGKFMNIAERDGLAENIVSRILVDAFDNFWVLGNRGIYTVNRASLMAFVNGETSRIYCTVYGVDDGLEISEGNGIHTPAGWSGRDGRLWFPMVRGGVVVDASSDRPGPPPVYIEKVYINGSESNSNSRLEIGPGQQNLQIEYTGVTFIKPEQVQFRYMLEGFDHGWNDVGTRRIAYYPYLPPGTYTFKVTSATGRGYDEATAAKLVIVIKGPFWKTTWFFVLVALLVIALLIFINHLRWNYEHRQRLRQQEYAKQLIQAHESERKRIAAELHDSLGHSLLVIKNWAAQAISKIEKGSDIKPDLAEISDTAASAIEETRTISNNLLPQHLQHFGLTSALHHMVKTIEESSSVSVLADIEDIDGLFETEGELSIFRIIQEALSNVVRHSEAKNAWVKVKQLAGSVVIEIRDNGKGFDAKTYNSSFFKITSFGINNIRQRTQLLGGNYSVKSEIGAGSATVVTLPIDVHGTKRN